MQTFNIRLAESLQESSTWPVLEVEVRESLEAGQGRVGRRAAEGVGTMLS